MADGFKLIPYNRLAEQTVLGCMLINKDAVSTAAQLLRVRDFYEPQNAEIFEGILDLFNLDKPVDLVSLTEQLKLRGSLDTVGGIEYMVQVANTTQTTGNLRYYANIVAEKSVLRRLIGSCEDISKLCYQEEEEVPKILDLAEQKIFEILENRDIQGFVPISEVLSINYNKLVELAGRQNEYTGVPTGFSDLDKVLNGMQRGNFILIAARPSMGKTSFALNIAHNAAEHKKSVAIFSLEMSKEELVNRMWSSDTFVEIEKIQRCDLDDREWTQLIDGMERISGMPIYIDDTGGTTVTDIRAKCRRLKREKGLDLIIIDHMQLMEGGKKNDNRQQQITEISRNLKLLAKDLDVPVVTLSQLNRAPDAGGGNHRPMLSHLRESGSIEQDADVVMMLYRDDYYNKETENPGVAECIIAKHRNGAVGTIELTWRSELTRFDTRVKTYDEQD